MDDLAVNIWDQRNIGGGSDIWDKLAHNLGYLSKNRALLVANNIVSSPPNRDGSGRLEYSLPLWRPLLLNSDLLGSHPMQHGHYLGNITVRFDNPNTNIVLDIREGEVVPMCNTDKTLIMGSIILSSLRKVDIGPPEKALTIWEAMLEKFNLGEQCLEFCRQFPFE
jgi:hypothetical protein